MISESTEQRKIQQQRREYQEPEAEKREIYRQAGRRMTQDKKQITQLASKMKSTKKFSLCSSQFVKEVLESSHQELRIGGKSAKKVKYRLAKGLLSSPMGLDRDCAGMP